MKKMIVTALLALSLSSNAFWNNNNDWWNGGYGWDDNGIFGYNSYDYWDPRWYFEEFVIKFFCLDTGKLQSVFTLYFVKWGKPQRKNLFSFVVLMHPWHFGIDILINPNFLIMVVIIQAHFTSAFF